jgi:peptide/nickel transport system ATP-binding protein
MQTEDVLMQVRDLQVAFQMGAAQTIQAVRGVSFTIPAEQTVALVGESGSGKSVTAMSLVQLLPENARVHPDSQILLGGKNLLGAPAQTLRAVRGKEIGMVFQDPMSSLNPVFTVGAQIAEVLRIHAGMTRRQAIGRVLELLDEVGIPDPRARINAYPHQLSGGQQQRVMIALAIACSPRLLIADEPTTALDVTVQRQIIDLLGRLQQKHRMSMLFISHDLNLVGELANEVIVMRHGEIREAGSVAAIFHSPRDPYTRALLACRPRLDARPHRLPTIEDWMSQADAPAAPAQSDLARQPPAPSRTPPGEVLLEVSGLRKDYVLKEGLFRRMRVTAVKQADFVLRKGATLGVVGESGSGKTTLGLMLTRLLEPSGGQIRFAGTDLTALSADAMRPFRCRIQIIFQNPYASLNPRFTIGQILTEPLQLHRIGENAAQRNQLALQWLARVGLPPEAMDRYPHEFSGGQRQRIAIARCLTMQPEVLVCDECVSALDVSVQATILNLLLDLQSEFGLSYVFISHDLAVVKYMAEQILVMQKGEIVEQGGAEQLYAHPGHPYTRQLLAAIPRGFQSAAQPAIV